MNDNVDMNTNAGNNPDEAQIINNNDDLIEDELKINLKDLFQPVRDQIKCKKLTKKVLEQTSNFFQLPLNKMNLSDQVEIQGLKYGLKPFQALGVYYMFSVEVTTLSGGILADDMGLGKVRTLLMLLHPLLTRCIDCVMLGKFVYTRWLLIINKDIQDKYTGVWTTGKSITSS